MKWLLRTVVALAAIVLVVTIAGMALPQKHVSQRSAHLSATPDKVWSVVTDVQSYPQWRSDVASIEMLSGDEGKVAWREVSPKGNKLSYEAAAAEPPLHFVTVITDKDIPFG